jgi:hypothetical protein
MIIGNSNMTPPMTAFKIAFWYAAFATCFLHPRHVFAQAGSNIVRPGSVWKDTQGAEIEAHGGGIIRYENKFFWFGEDRTPGRDPAKRFVSCYESSDFVHWTSHGDALALADLENIGIDWVLERPKVYYNPRGRQFVMYFHLDDSQYKLARVGIATSSSACGPYAFVRSFRPLGEESRDIGQFVDDDGTAYLIFESRPTKGFFIAKLTADDLDIAEKTSFVPAPLEGGSLVHLGDWYYVIGSHMTGWRPNPDVYAVAHSINGPWSSFENIAPPETNTYGSQPTMLFKLKGTRKTPVIYMGDIWNPHALWDSRYLWMPLDIANGKLRLPNPKPWKVDSITGATNLQ